VVIKRLNEIDSMAPGDKGTYVLEMRLSLRMSITVGKLGEFSIKPGWYYYVGSALNGLRGRLRRHFTGMGKTHWHIDHLTKKVRPSRIWFVISGKRFESQVAGILADEIEVGIPGFGCGDSPESGTHLFYSKKRVDLDDLLSEIGRHQGSSQASIKGGKISGYE
jgi:Uri superfamily endonuclease